jgi:hypothetical protein
MVTFVGFAIYASIAQLIISSDKLDIFAQRLSDIAVYFLPFDQEVSQQLLLTDRLVSQYRQGDNILQSHS